MDGRNVGNAKENISSFSCEASNADPLDPLDPLIFSYAANRDDRRQHVLHSLVV